MTVSFPRADGRTFVKICGITRAADACAALALGADALGFVLYPPSPRSVSLEAARAILDPLGPLDQWAVAVTVQPTIDEMDAIARGGFGALQLHGDEGPETVDAARARFDRVLLARRLATAADLEALDRLPAEVIPLLDARRPTAWGGTGEAIDPALLAAAGEMLTGRPFIVAGGLGPDNVAERIRLSRAAGADASSRLEAAPGCKDPDRLAAFFASIAR